MTTTKKTAKTSQAKPGKPGKAKAPAKTPLAKAGPDRPLATGESYAFIGGVCPPKAPAAPAKPDAKAPASPKVEAPRKAKPAPAKPKAPSKFSLLRAALLTGKPHTVEDLMKLSGFDKRNTRTALYIVAHRPPKGTDPIKTSTDDQGRVVLAK